MPYERTPITHVAIRYEDKVYSLPKPNRHHDVIWLIAKELSISYVKASGEDQGFLDESGTYLTRKQALVSAMMFDQIKEGSQIVQGMLFSENLW